MGDTFILVIGTILGNTNPSFKVLFSSHPNCISLHFQCFVFRFFKDLHKLKNSLHASEKDQGASGCASRKRQRFRIPAVLP